MATFHVQRQPWQRWPRTLVCVKENDDGTREERKYQPGETYWKELCRKESAAYGRKARSYEEVSAELYEVRKELDRRQAEIDGLTWQLEDARKLIRDLFDDMACEPCGNYHRGDCMFNGDVLTPENCIVVRRMAEIGLELEP